jgi:ABC-2 type transport system ATP-binding protein
MMGPPVIEVTGISKGYFVSEPEEGIAGFLRGFFHRRGRTQVAIHPVSFSINRGDIAGFVGPNGAGKSTLVKMLTGILRPDTGKIRVLGMDPFHDRRDCCSQIGVVFGQRSNLWWDLPAKETFRFVSTLYKIPRSEFEQTLSALSRVFDLSDLIHQPVRTLSLGQRVRCSLTAALLPRPQILFLDEPTIGLDAIAVAQLVQMLREINILRQTTIIITSHDLAVIEQLCGRIFLFDQGKVVFDGTVLSAVNRYARYKKLRLVFRGGRDMDSKSVFIPPEWAAGTITPDGIEWIVMEGQASEQALIAIVRDLSDRGFADYYIEKPSLQEVLLNAFR